LNKTNKDKGLFLQGNIWWTKIRGIRDSTGTSDLKEATRILAVRKGKVAEGRTLLQRVDQIRFPEAKADLLSWYETYNTRDLGEATRRFKHIDPFFKRRRLVEIMPALITGYVGKRRKDGASDGTIYVEIATIRKLLTVAYENNKLDRRPIIHNIEVNNTRSGFFEREKFEEVREYLPPHIQLAITIQYLVGWRTREVLKLEWRQIDFEAGTIRLDAGTTKNKEGRIVYMTPELKMMFLEQRERVKALQRNTGQVIPYVFCHLGGEK
jgi:integrase